MRKLNDTIVALATPYGKGAISIIRLSGPDSLKILKKIFRCKKDFTRRGIYKGLIVDGNKIIDEAVVIVYRQPKSFTGEDLVEINCHGGIIITKNILNLCLKHNARLAERGEFSLRAFLNKKIDLVQAEAINDLVNAKSEKFVSVAISTLLGNFSKFINNISNKLKNLLVKLEVSIDHPDEDIEFINKSEIKRDIEEIISIIEEALSTAETGKFLNYGVNIVIVGKANVGKSTLFNLLIKKDKAITSEIPGTTRDAIEEWLDINGVPVKIIDTAGFKFKINKIEDKAILKTEEMINQSDLIIAMLDASVELDDFDIDLINKLNQLKKKIIFVVNKIDLPVKIDYDKFSNLIKKNFIKISAKTSENISQLEKAIEKLVIDEKILVKKNDMIITNVRYENLLKESLNNLKNAKEALKGNLTEDLIASDIRRAIKSLEEITGEFTTEELLNSIFSNFCIGK